jgi:hypothetical protein
LGGKTADIAALAMDPVLPDLSQDDPWKWLRGRRKTRRSRLLPQKGIQGHLQACLEARLFDTMFEQTSSIFLVTETHSVLSWATTVRHPDEATMKLGIDFSKGKCVDFGWETLDQKCSELPHALPSDELSAVFMSGYYIFAREGFSSEDPQAVAGLPSPSRHSSTFTTGSFSGTASYRAEDPSAGGSQHSFAAGRAANAVSAV